MAPAHDPCLQPLASPHSGKLKLVTQLDLSMNHLSGEIPTTIGKLRSLQYLGLSHNDLYGEIPESISTLQELVRYMSSVVCGVWSVRGVARCSVVWCSVVWCIWYTCMVRNAQRMAVIHGLATLMRPPHTLTLTLTVGDPKLAIEPS